MNFHRHIKLEKKEEIKLKYSCDRFFCQIKCKLWMNWLKHVNICWMHNAHTYFGFSDCEYVLFDILLQIYRNFLLQTTDQVQQAAQRLLQL